MKKVDVSIVIVNYNTKDLTLGCVDSIVKNTKDIDYEIIVTDNASEDKLPSSSYYTLINNKENKGFAKANNEAIEKAKGQYILLLNSDTVLNSNVIAKIKMWMDENSQIGIATCKLLNKDGTIQGTGGFFPTLPRVMSWMIFQDLPFVDLFIKPFHPIHAKSIIKGSNFYDKEQELDWITGAFMFIRRKVIKEVGAFDDKFFMYGEDVDLCFRAKTKGWHIKYLPYWSITHFGGSSSTAEFPVVSEYKGIKFFYKKHYPAWQYPILRFLLKVGALGRMVILGILEGGSSVKTYAKAFKEA